MLQKFHVTGNAKVEISLITLVGEQRKYLRLQSFRLGRIGSFKPFAVFDYKTSEVLDVSNRLFDVSGKLKTYNILDDGYELTFQSSHKKHDLWDAVKHWDIHHINGCFQFSLLCLDDCVFQIGDIGDEQEDLCPAGTTPGDLAVILYGGSVPYLLQKREAKGLYAFVGQCYIIGRMDQNMLLPFEEESKAPETFILV
jgi:hypothetical protein